VTDIDPNWAEMNLRTASLTDGEMVLTYTVVMPLDSNIRDGYTWIDTSKISNDHPSYEELSLAVRGIA